MINVLIVDDSATVRQHLKRILEVGGVRVIGMAENGEDAVRFVQEQKPDLITMDIEMPKMNGLDATRRIMETNPLPIVIVSANYDRNDVEKSFLAMSSGAVAILEKPLGEGHQGYEESVRELVQTVKLMSEVKVVKRWPSARTGGTVPIKAGIGRGGEKSQYLPFSLPLPIPLPDNLKLIALGASTGGPPVIQTILSGLPREYGIPVLVVQHIAKGFIEGMVEWLNQTTSLHVKIAVDGEHLLPGHVYFAPDDFHMGVRNSGRIALSKSEPENGIRPSVSYLFRSAMNRYGGEMAGVLLTGMGKDGAEELKHLKDKGALTIAQDKDSSVVFGMPGEAVKLEAATCVLPPDKIASTLAGLMKRD